MNLRQFSDSATMMTEAATRLSGTLSTQSGSPFAVMLSGGQTPLRAYERLAVLRAPVSPQAFVFFSDERHVPLQSPESNLGRIRPLLLAARIPEEHMLRVNTESELAEAADEYDRTLRDFLAKGGTIPLGFLGIGADGHTASLFTPADLERGRNRYAIAVLRPSKPDRISVTPKLLERIDHIIFLVCGSEKSSVVNQMLRSPGSLVAGRAVATAHNVDIWFAPNS